METDEERARRLSASDGEYEELVTERRKKRTAEAEELETTGQVLGGIAGFVAGIFLAPRTDRVRG